MNKLIFYILFFISTAVFGQAKTTVAKPQPIRIDTADIDQRTFRANFQSNYTSEDFQYKTILKDTSRWENFKAWLLYWLERLFSFEGKGNSDAFNITIKIIAGIIMVLAVYFIAKAIINKEGKWLFGKSSQKKISTSEILEEDIHNIDFATIIRNSKKANNHRLSIRYYYLWLLKRMSDRSIIEWDIEKTNSDYLREIRHDRLKDEFKYLSYIYDYSWYGEFGMDEVLFEKAEKEFVKTINSL